MRLQLNRPVQVNRAITSRKKVNKQAKAETKRVSPPPMDEAEIRSKIAKRKQEMANPQVKAVSENKGQLKDMLKNSKFNFSARERAVFAKILKKD